MQIVSEVSLNLQEGIAFQDFGYLLRRQVLPFGIAAFIAELYRTVLL